MNDLCLKKKIKNETNCELEYVMLDRDLIFLLGWVFFSSPNRWYCNAENKKKNLLDQTLIKGNSCKQDFSYTVS